MNLVQFVIVHVAVYHVELRTLQCLLQTFVFSFGRNLDLFNVSISLVLARGSKILQLEAVWRDDVFYPVGLTVDVLQSNDLLKNNDIVLIKSMMLLVLSVDDSLLSNACYEGHYLCLSVGVTNEVVVSKVCKNIAEKPLNSNSQKSLILISANLVDLEHCLQRVKISHDNKVIIFDAFRLGKFFKNFNMGKINSDIRIEFLEL